jgi:hypothetical protein
MCCVKEAARTTDQTDIAITRCHFDAALALLTPAHIDDAKQEPTRLLLVG